MAESLYMLVVDDDDVATESIVRSLHKSNVSFPVVTAEDGAVALEILRGQHLVRHIGQPNVVLLDLNMPRMNGFEFLEALRNDVSLAHTIVFVLTTSDDDRDISRAYHENVAGYFVKSAVGPQFRKLVALMERYADAVRFCVAA